VTYIYIIDNDYYIEGPYIVNGYMIDDRRRIDFSSTGYFENNQLTSLFSFYFHNFAFYITYAIIKAEKITVLILGGTSIRVFELTPETRQAYAYAIRYDSGIRHLDELFDTYPTLEPPTDEVSVADFIYNVLPSSNVFQLNAMNTLRQNIFNSVIYGSNGNIINEYTVTLEPNSNNFYEKGLHIMEGSYIYNVVKELRDYDF
jgi:hypothetical protein